MRPAPAIKARELLARYGTAPLALAFAATCLAQHTAGEVSHTYWAAVMAALEKPPGKPHTRHQRHKLRGDTR